MYSFSARVTGIAQSIPSSDYVYFIQFGQNLFVINST